MIQATIAMIRHLVNSLSFSNSSRAALLPVVFGAEVDVPALVCADDDGNGNDDDGDGGDDDEGGPVVGLLGVVNVVGANVGVGVIGSKFVVESNVDVLDIVEDVLVVEGNVAEDAPLVDAVAMDVIEDVPMVAVGAVVIVTVAFDGSVIGIDDIDVAVGVEGVIVAVVVVIGSA